MIISGAVLIFIGIFGGGRVDVIGLGASLLFAAGLFQTIEQPAGDLMIAWLAAAAVAIIPIAIVVSILALIVWRHRLVRRGATGREASSPTGTSRTLSPRPVPRVRGPGRRRR